MGNLKYAYTLLQYVKQFFLYFQNVSDVEMQRYTQQQLLGI